MCQNTEFTHAPSGYSCIKLGSLNRNLNAQEFLCSKLISFSEVG